MAAAVRQLLPSVGSAPVSVRVPLVRPPAMLPVGTVVLALPTLQVATLLADAQLFAQLPHTLPQKAAFRFLSGSRVVALRRELFREVQPSPLPN